MIIKPICPYSFGANTYLLISGGHAFVVDPSTSVDALRSALDKENATLEGILLTHGHFDHTVAVDTLREALNIPLYVHKEDAEMLTNGKINGYYTFMGKECVHKAADKLFCDGDVLTLGNETIKVVGTPGHSKGSVCFLCDGFMVTGDTLFSNSIGRCDLWGGNEQQIKDSLIKLRSFDNGLTIYPGHGESALLGEALDNAEYYF
jgi:glyoxylase-like metal-dependent hydrolase (beta-lactamase superfamily II)